MITTSRRAARLRAVTVLAMVLILAGAGGAAAYWTASAQLDSSASAATVGITQTDPLKLANQYNAGNLAAAGTVTIKNTGAREAALAVTVGGTGSETLRNALTVRIAEVANQADCTPGAVLKTVADGKLGLSYTRTLDAGASLTLCVQTSLPPREAFLLAGKSTEVKVTSTLTYATGADWTVSAAASVGQSVASDPAAGGPELTCRNWESLIWLNFLELSGRFQPRDGQLKASLVQGGAVLDIPSHLIDFQAQGKDGTATVTEQTLRGLKGRTAERGWIVIEQQAGNGDWKIVGVSKVHFDRILLTTDVECGW